MPKVVVIAGPNGAGKSTTAPRLLREALAVERIAERVRRGGHTVPEMDIRRRYVNSLSNFFNLYRPIADSWLMLDNSQQPEPRPVAWRNIGGPIHIVQDGPWKVLRQRYEKDILDQR